MHIVCLLYVMAWIHPFSTPTVNSLWLR